MPRTPEIRRRDLLRAGALAGAGLALPLGAFAKPASARSCILLVLTGGPSHLDTWDMKPDAPADIRGPFRPIPTNVPGVQISEIFPRMAKHADKYAIVRGIHHDIPPMHPEPPGFGVQFYPDAEHSFAQNCIRARKLVESGVPFVTVHMFRSIYSETTWDSHGYRPFSTMSDYRDTVGPMFDRVFTGLITDLHDRCLLQSTMVIAMGEFGRSPRINSTGGRDHWPECGVALVAGGGIEGGHVIGSSDAIGAYPRDRAITPGEILAPVRQLFA